MDQPLSLLTEYLSKHGVGGTLAQPLATIMLLTVALLVAWLVDFVAKRIILRLVKGLAKRTKTHWDNALVDAHVFDRLAHLAPALVVYGALPVIFPQHEQLENFLQRVTMAFMILTVALGIGNALSAAVVVLRTYDPLGRTPFRTYAQVGQIIVFVVAAILVISTLLDESPWALLSGIGALTAVVMLVFKDSILGFVASVQLTANDMVRRGDWIEMPKYGADGDVMDVSLNTVKVQNWDKTISTIPTYQLMQESFKNWRGMSESGGRRIKRSLYIDMNSIKFCDEKLIERFQRIELLSDYMHEKREEVAASNQGKVDASLPTNLRRLTNVGTFRAYVVAYLRVHPKIHQKMTFLVRQLQPTDRGLPLEVYVFSNDQNWARYEGIQADLFDHFLAVLPEFELRVFQLPTGADLEVTKETAARDVAAVAGA